MTARPQVTQRQVDRFIELVGSFGLSQAEAAGAVGFSIRTAERIISKPENRERVERLRQIGRGMAFTARSVIEEMLRSDNDAMRAKGAELLLKHKAELDEIEGEDAPEDSLPEGVTIVYPRAR